MPGAASRLACAGGVLIRALHQLAQEVEDEDDSEDEDSDDAPDLDDGERGSRAIAVPAAAVPRQQLAP